MPFYVKTGSEGQLEGTENELPEPPGDFSYGGENSTSDLAVDPSSGTIYVTNPRGEAVDVYNKQNELQPETLSIGESFKPVAVAVDPTNGEVYVVDYDHKVVDEFDAASELIGELTGAHTPAGRFIEPRNVAVKPSTHEVYVADEGAQTIDIFGADETGALAPKPTTEAATEIGPEGATLNGAVERAEGEQLSWFYPYARGDSCTGGKGASRAAFAAGEKGLLHVHAQLSNLEPFNRILGVLRRRRRRRRPQPGCHHPLPHARARPRRRRRHRHAGLVLGCDPRRHAERREPGDPLPLRIRHRPDLRRSERFRRTECTSVPMLQSWLRFSSPRTARSCASTSGSKKAADDRGPAGPRVTLRAGIAHEREWVRFWGSLAKDRGKAGGGS